MGEAAPPFVGRAKNENRRRVRLNAGYCGGPSGSEFMEWFSRTTSVAGIQIPNWVLVLGAIIIVWLIYRST